MKKTEAHTYLCAGQDTDWAGLASVPGALGALVDKELARLGIQAIGPTVMFYRFQKDPHRPEGKHGRFLLEIGLPVDADQTALRGYAGPLTLKRTGGETCASTIHQGPLNRLPWKELRDLAEQHGQRTLEEREIYFRTTADARENQIELQCLIST